MKEFLAVAASICILFALLLAAIVLPISYLERLGCAEEARIMQLEHTYSLKTSCMIKTPQGWINKNSYIIIKEK